MTTSHFHQERNLCSIPRNGATCTSNSFPLAILCKKHIAAEPGNEIDCGWRHLLVRPETSRTSQRIANCTAIALWREATHSLLKDGCAITCILNRLFSSDLTDHNPLDAHLKWDLQSVHTIDHHASCGEFTISRR